MNYIKKKKKILFLHYLCTFSILISLTSSDSGLSVFKSHAVYINQTEIELIVSNNPEKCSWNYINTTSNKICDNSDGFKSRDRFYEILEKYNLVIRHLYKVQKSVKNSNQSTLFFLHTKCRNRLSSDNDQSLVV